MMCRKVEKCESIHLTTVLIVVVVVSIRIHGIVLAVLPTAVVVNIRSTVLSLVLVVVFARLGTLLPTLVLFLLARVAHAAVSAQCTVVAQICWRWRTNWEIGSGRPLDRMIGRAHTERIAEHTIHSAWRWWTVLYSTRAIDEVRRRSKAWRGAGDSTHPSISRRHSLG